jgi:hypothetical protein
MDQRTYDENLFKALHYSSYSRMGTFFDCSQYFLWYYVYGVKPEFESPALTKGDTLHKYYQVLNDVNATPEARKEVVEKFTKQFPLEFMKYSTKWKSHVKKLPQGPNVVLEKEMQMSIPISSPLLNPSGKPFNSIIFKGYIDYLNFNQPKTAYVIDYKSGRAATAPKYADQLAIYAAMVFSAFPMVDTVRAYTYDISDNMNSEVSEQNSFEFDRGKDSQNLIDTLAKMMETMISAASKKEFSPTPCIRCSYCPDYSCRFNRVPPSKRGVTAQPDLSPPTPTPPPAPIQQEYDTYGSPIPPAPTPAPTEIPIETVTQIGEKEKAILLEMKKKLDRK